MREVMFVLGLLLFAVTAMTAITLEMPYRIVPALFGGMVGVSLYLQFTSRDGR